MAGDWRINAEDRVKYDSYFQQCNPIQGYVTGDRARNFFVQSGLPADVLRKIWDLSDLTTDGRLDKREFTIACHLISSQVQKKCPLPPTLPPTLLSDAIIATSNGLPQPMPSLSTTRPSFFWSAPSQPLIPGQQIRPTVISPPTITPTIRSKYLQQFHSLVDVSKTNGFMSGLQAKNVLQHTGLSQTLLHQIWNLSDNDKDGRLTADEFVIAMHCCDIIRSGQTLPTRLPDEWLKSGTQTPLGRTNSLAKSMISPPTFPSLSPMINDENHSPETIENERKNSLVTYEEKRQMNYEAGHKELERRRQLLREQEEREQREREERERKREFDLQKQKDEQERRKQLEHERQLERQRQIEQQKEEERRKLFEQRETARKEMERKSRLEWERQRMQELSSQKSRLLEQINDLKSREKALGLELQSMDDTMQTCQHKIQQTNINIQTIDHTIDDIQKRMLQERNLLDKCDQQKKDFMMKFHRIQNERDTIDTSVKQISQSKEFGKKTNEFDQMKFVQLQYDNVKQENSRIDEQITTMTQQCKQYQNQMDQLRKQLTQLEQDAKNKKPTNQISSPPVYSNSNDFNSLNVDPFQTVDPFANPSDIGSPTTQTNHDWFQSSTAANVVHDPFLSKNENSPKDKKTTTPKKTSTIDPWSGSTSTSHGNGWAAFNQTTTAVVEYRALYDYEPKNNDEIAMKVGDIITVDPSQQQDENWLFGKIGNNIQGYFPAPYAERVPSTPNGNNLDTNSALISGSWVIALADYTGKTVDKHLSFQKGEMILVREQKDATWYSGQLRGKIGWFPRNHVRPATDIEMQNNKNTTISPLSSPTSPNENGIAWRQAPTIPAIPDIYEALYPYEATDPGDLSFQTGERIIVLKREGDWWTGKINDRTGAFPSNYVQKIENPLLETAVSIAPFHTADEGRLSFDQGQTIFIRKKGDKGWYQGEIRNADQPIRVGWFPANCVQLQSPVTTPTISSFPTYQNTSNELPRYIAIFPYEAQQDDELSFPADAIFEILEETGQAGWLKARYNNKIGLIPATYVKPIEELNPSRQTIISNDDKQTTNSLRISAIRELIETEQRYVDDLLTISDQFIRPLNTSRILSDYDVEQIFINWFSLIALNKNLLTALQQEVNYKDDNNNNNNNEVFMRTSRSVSMSNIALAAQLSTKAIIDNRHRSFTPDVTHSPSTRRFKTRLGGHHRSPSSNALTVPSPGDHLNSSNTSTPSTSSSMIITDATKIGEILCFHLPHMVNDYFQYCNSRSQANRCLQNKIDSNEKFRSYMKIFQDQTGGLSLNGFLTKPIQRVTRYPLLIEKILKHTPTNHFDYHSIKTSLDLARQLNEKINQQISEQESQSRLDWLQQHVIVGSDENSSDGYVFDELLKFNSLTRANLPRQLIFHGFITKVPTGKELLAFLFNDFLLFSTIKSSSNNWQTQLFEPRSNLQLKLYRTPILLSEVIIANDSLQDQLTFSITTRIYDKPIVLKSQQTNVRTLWVKSINNAVEEWQTTEKSIQADKALFTVTDNKRQSKVAVARLLLVVQEAHDIMPSQKTLERHRSIDPYCEITIGSLTLKTPYIKKSIKPKWNAPMQFLLYDFVEEIIHINLFDNEVFSPNENLGSTSVHLTDILPCPLSQFLTQPSQPFTQRIYLNNGSSITLKCTVQLLST